MGTALETELSWPVVVDRLQQSLSTRIGSRDRLPLGNRLEPYDELVYILLTVMTRSQPRLDLAMEGLVALRDGRSWSALLEVDRLEVRRVLQPLGFVNRRTEQLLEIVRRVEVERGGSLDFLYELDDADALAYLTSLPGIGVKTAKCVLLYSLGRDVLPVDIHVLRVAKRLGLVESEATWAAADRQLEGEVPDELKFAVHVGLVIHGREVCKSPNPQCADCVLLDLCPTGHLAPRLRKEYAR